MQQRGVHVFLTVLAVTIFLSFSLTSVLAANETSKDAAVDVESKVSTDTSVNVDAQLSVGAGITPDSNFYWVEKNVLSKFRSDIVNLEKNVAQIKAMVERKDYESARIALVRYKEYAANIEKNIAPEDKAEVERAIAAINNALKEIESQIPAEQKKEFVEDVRDEGKRVADAARIADTINKLCGELATLDPKQYATTCRTTKDSPKWQQKEDKRWTEAQKKEAREFGSIMSQCMKTQGRECRCKDISVSAFADKCALIAPLATKCEEGDEEACGIMEEATADMEDLLPPHLQDVLEDIEGGVREEQFDKFMPPECKKAGAKTPKECMRVMFEKNAPEECIAAAKEGKVDFTSERTMRESCEKLMFLANAPQECIEKGLKDHRTCGKYMCENNLAQECKDAGLTCERPESVFRKCDEIMRSQRENEGPNRGPGRGFAFGKNCNTVENKDEKLKCFEEMFNQVQGKGFPGQGPENFGSFNDDFVFGEEGQGQGKREGSGKGQGKNFPEQCVKAGATTREACEKIMRAESESRSKDMRDYTENFARECRAKGGRWDCGYSNIDPSNPCRCFTDERREERREEFRPPEQQRPQEGQQYQRPPEGQQYQQPPTDFRPPEGQQQQPSTTTQPPSNDGSATTGGTSSAGTSTSTGTTTGTSTGTSTDTSTSTSSGSTSTSPTSTSTSSGSSSGTSSPTTPTTTAPTGGVITGNAFLEYYFD